MTLDEQSDVELVRQFKSGESRAFDIIVERFQDRIYRLACVWLYDPQNAADVTQEVFVRAYTGLRRFRFRSHPFTWLYRTARNVCSEFNRARRAEPLEQEPTDESESPHRDVSDFERARRVRELVGKLPDRQQEVVMLRIFEDLSVKEAARLMGCREGTVKALLYKATRNLKLSVAQLGIEND